MSTGIARTTSLATVSATLGGDGSIRPWVHPDVVGGTAGWSKQASTSNPGLYDETKNRRVLARDGTSDDVSTGLEYSWSAADSSVTGSVGWGKPVRDGAASLVVVFRPGSL